ncbi:hypothetical protein GCM10008910_32810 [Faecalicatena orotica]|uniref:ABC-2 family transporter protein n=1 Tax=Faecalicatena orotica TaxID=1544 RepID=A0A2Y9BJF1_9FIRM|nr:hypothetical protein [Faecalicatena orotica]PWJ23465.1 hypothetical protein A8806_11491 [Faecalicatena orotica]SSA57727.1 hypothetical protein SAMN05216536_11491 [Faecalicatena orotica]
MKKILENIRYDLYRSMYRKSYVVKIILIAAVCLMSQVDVLRDLYYGRSLEGYDIIGVYNFIIHFDRFKIVLLVIIASIYTDSFCVDFNCHYLKYIIVRSGLKIYIISRIIAICISGIIAYIGGVTVYFIILASKMPLTELENPIFPQEAFASFEELPPHEHAWLWLTLTSVLFILSVLIFCVAGFYISIFLTDSLAAICMPTILYFALASVTFLFPEILYIPAYGNNVLLLNGDMWVNYFYKILVNIAGIVLFTALSYLKLRRKGYEGVL